ncbi:calpain-A-like isoform X2 [Anneissia japonica]|uniref:calpain-A-like isoform X2 n=1 Tax=Anneissia japonica TaxID=1529436 RepID=UPI0014259D8C|nr:calpain-A-like isoform X2 [Anneissia japonica]
MGASCSNGTTGTVDSVQPEKTLTFKELLQTWTSDEGNTVELPVEELVYEPHPDGNLVFGTTENYEVFFEEVKKNSTNDQLFEDDVFPADSSSLYFVERDSNVDDVEWKRPHELCNAPLLQVDGISRDDVIQGALSDCWFLASCAGVAKHKALISMVVKGDQPLHGEGYCGIVHFRFWRFGSWVDVIIDDRLPTVNGKLLYAHSSNTNEFWPALIEKAYAKLNGAYDGLNGGMASDAMVDLTGGLAEVFKLKPESGSDLEIFRDLYRGIKCSAFMTCSKKGAWQLANTDAQGIVSGHSYTITAVKWVSLVDDSQMPLLRVRNPWGNSSEWTGDFSDGSPAWNRVKPNDKEALDPQDKDDGEFWISYQDFCGEFTRVIMCRLAENQLQTDLSSLHTVSIRGAWIKGVTAGGSRNDIDSFMMNKQYILRVTEADEWNSEEDTSAKWGRCSVIISLLQEYRSSKKNYAAKKDNIGFVVYKTPLEDGKQGVSKEDILYTQDIGTSGPFINHREVNRKFDLDPGNYVIIPSTFHPGEVSSFMLRLFSEKPIEIELAE